MGVKLTVAAAALFVLLITAVGWLLIPAVMCDTPNCSKVVDKSADLEAALNTACLSLRRSYNCSDAGLNLAHAEYNEYKQPVRNYTVSELCEIENQYMIGVPCQTYCGC